MNGKQNFNPIPPFASLRLCAFASVPYPTPIIGTNMYSISYLSRQVESLRRRLKPVLAIFKLRNLAMEFCDEYDEALRSEDPQSRNNLSNAVRMFPSRVGQAGFRLDTYPALVKYFLDCLSGKSAPEPREAVFTLIPWARKGPHLRPNLWERPAA